MVGTNDVDNVVYSLYGPVGYKLKVRNHHAPKTPVSLEDIKADFDNMVDFIRDFIPCGTIVVVAVIPRPGDWAWSQELVIQFNDHMQIRCCKEQAIGRQAIFVPTYKFFLKGGPPVARYFVWDGIHLSGLGLKRIKQALQQALSEAAFGTGDFGRGSRRVGASQRKLGRGFLWAT